MGRRLIEAVPNFSEGRSARVLLEIEQAIRDVAGTMILDRHQDEDHNRSVITFAAPAAQMVEAAVAAAGRAAALIDLNEHQGVHPRIGAMDVLPFVPLEESTVDDCLAVAREAAAAIWSRLGIPSYYYETAALRDDRRNLEDVRRGQFEQLRAWVLTDPSKRPDTGGPALHPTAGAICIGVRKFLLAYNINLTTPDLKAAREIARRIRSSGGGLPKLKAIGLMLGSRNIAQVSMNLTDFEVTPLDVVFRRVEQEARQLGVEIAGSEIVGLVPRKALEMTGGFDLRFENFTPAAILENRLAELESNAQLESK